MSSPPLPGGLLLYEPPSASSLRRAASRGYQMVSIAPMAETAQSAVTNGASI